MHEAMGPEARWRRYVAELLQIIATGKRLDPERSQTYGEILAEIYKNPFEKIKKAPRTSAEIIGYIGDRVRALLDGGE